MGEFDSAVSVVQSLIGKKFGNYYEMQDRCNSDSTYREKIQEMHKWDTHVDDGYTMIDYYVKDEKFTYSGTDYIHGDGCASSNGKANLGRFHSIAFKVGDKSYMIRDYGIIGEIDYEDVLYAPSESGLFDNHIKLGELLGKPASKENNSESESFLDKLRSMFNQIF